MKAPHCCHATGSLVSLLTVVSFASALGASVSSFFLPTEEDVRWYRNPRDLDMYDDVFVLPPTGLLMPPVEADTEELKKVELTGGFGRCNDGSNPVYFLGYGTEATKWVLFFEGGDWCTRYESTGDKDRRRNCLERRDKTGLQGGTTRDDPDALNLDWLGREYGQFSTDKERNPLMYNWNKVYIRNCDSSSFTSARVDVVREGDDLLYFRGKYILDEMLADLLGNRNLAHATDVVVTGCSAGALGVYMHSDLIKDSIQGGARKLGREDADDVKVIAMADSGFFLHHAGGPGDCNFIQRMQFMYQEMNITSGLQPECVSAFGEANRYKCLFAETAIHFSQVPIFTLQSIYDGWQLRWIGCDSEDDGAKAWYGNEMWDALELATRHPKNGGFIDACQHHCHCYESINIDGDNQATAFMKFYNGDSSKRVWKSQTCDTDLGGECPLKRG